MPEDITTELVWTGTDETEVFIDAAYNDEYHPKDPDTENPHTVLAKRAEWLLEHEGWEVPAGTSEAEFRQSLPDDLESDAEAADAQRESPESTADENASGMITVGTNAGQGQGQTEGERGVSHTVSDAQTPQESAGVEGGGAPSDSAVAIENATEAAEAVDSDEDFDAEDYLEQTDWRGIRAAIMGGEVDEYLEAIAAAERGRDSPREASVLSAIEQRQVELSNGVGDTDADGADVSAGESELEPEADAEREAESEAEAADADADADVVDVESEVESEDVEDGGD